ncbi:MAG: hypothetical protein R3E79_60670 [Caldilineaceae bacterium]
MPILKPEAITNIAPPPTNFIDRIRAGRVVPIISDDACFNLVLNGHANFLAGYHEAQNPPTPPPQTVGDAVPQWHQPDSASHRAHWDRRRQSRRSERFIHTDAQGNPLLYTRIVIQAQQVGRYTPFCGQGNDDGLFISKMRLPQLCTRIKQRSKFISQRIERSNVTTLEPIALEAGKRQILQRGGTAMLFRNDVIDFMGKKAYLRFSTIFATTVGPFNHSAAHRIGNRCRH